MNHTYADRIDASTIPVIDISSLRNATDSDTVSRALHRASKGLGFIYVSGHGIPDSVIHRTRRAAYDFFQSPEALKQTVNRTDWHRGYLGAGGAVMQDDALPDLKESFIFGFEDEKGECPNDHPLRGPNRWPDFVPDLQTAAMAFYYHGHIVAHHLMRGFALGLGLSDDFFIADSHPPLSRASLVYYPPQDMTSEESCFGVGPHTDFGMLTVLCQDNVGGLQVQTVDGRWIHAPPIEGTLVVNVGDLLARYTDGAYISTPHRVVNHSGRERLSLVLAYDPDADTVIDPRRIYGADYTTASEPITCGDYLIWRFGKAFAYRNRSNQMHDPR
ncbi:MAG: 2OG-Fe(II) oxygenase [marine bacterium B5-7]|nr:MAG: 2OG-Fe(II) oxygenase [marine bacterium B5-7]